MIRLHGSGLGVMGALAVGLLSVGCTSAPNPWKEVPGSPRIVVTIPPLYSFVRAVAGKEAAIQCLCTTTGPHHYETDHREARLLDGADVFFAVGLSLDDKFADALHTMSRKRAELPLVKLGERLKEKGLVRKMREHDEKEKAGGEHHHHHGEYDPHVWLGPEQVIALVGLIRDELVKVDEKHADDYKKNAAAYVKRLRKLHADGKAMFAKKKVRRIISFHDALEYFAHGFGLEIADVIEMAPGDHPTAVHMADLIKHCQAEPIGAITVEPQYPESGSAGVVRRALKDRGITVALVTVDPLETANPDELNQEGATWYEARMRSNLKALADVLK